MGPLILHIGVLNENDTGSPIYGGCLTEYQPKERLHIYSHKICISVIHLEY